MKRLRARCQRCYQRCLSLAIKPPRGGLRYTLKQIKGDLYECVCCGHRQKKK